MFAISSINTLLLRVLALGGIVAVSGCATSPPQRMDSVCHIFDEKYSWYKAAKKAEKNWGVPVSVMMSFIHQESRYHAKAKPPRKKILWVIPGPRVSSAYGYPQAKKETWRWYQRDTGNSWSNRSNFDDAIDFIGWYNDQSHRRNHIAKNDAYNLYLAYHEGHGGFARRTYDKKAWLKPVASKVAAKASRYATQLAQCREKLDKRRWWHF